MAIGYVPHAVFAALDNVRIEVPDVAIDVAEKDAVTPEGMPLAARFTVPLNPGKPPTVIVEMMELPATMLTDVGDAEIVKSGTLTVRFTVAVCTRLPLVPRTVIA